MNGVRLYFRYIRLHFLSQLQYTLWPMALLTTALFVATDPLDALLMFDRFGAIGEWTASRILLMYGMALFAFGLAELFARGLDYFPQLVRGGEFDRMLLRPRSLLLQSMATRFHLNRLARVVGGLALLIVSLRTQGVVLGAMDLAMLALAILGGVLFYMGAFLLAAGVAFFTIASVEWVNVLTNGSYQALKVPPQYLPPWLRGAITFVFPILAYAYYPTSAICGWGEPYALGFAALPAGAAFFALCYAFWRFGVRHYKSTGS